MAGGSGGGDEELITAINVTPLVDVVLVLLIILMVSANQLAANKQIPMELPEADSGDPERSDEPTTLRVSIVPNGTLYLDGEEIAEDSLRSRIRTARTESEDVRAVIAADGSGGAPPSGPSH